MFILKTVLKTCFSKWKRFVIFICLTALLSFLTGLLGNYFLYKEKAVEPITIAIVDLDGSIESKLFLKNITGNEQYKDFLIFENTTEQEAELLLDQNIAAAVFTIPEGFAEYVKNGENRPFTAVYNSSMPIKTALIEYFANGLTQMLMASQIGVYTALDYAYENGTNAQYDRIFRTANTKYLSTVLARDKIIVAEEVSVTGALTAFQYYFFAAYIFLMLAGTVLFIDILQGIFTKDTLIRMRLRGVSSFKITLGAILAVFIVLLIINGVFLAALYFAKGIVPQIPLNKQFIIAVLLISLCVAAFAVLVSVIFKNVFSAGVFISLSGIIMLFGSGGIIPVDYLSASINTFSRFTINYWGAKLLNGAVTLTTDYNNIKMFSFFILVYLLLSFIIFKIKAKAGDAV